MRRNRVLLAMGAVVAAVLVYAWVDAGREPVRTITSPVELPEAAR